MTQYERVRQYLRVDLNAQEGLTLDALPVTDKRNTSFLLPNLKLIIISHNRDGEFEAFYQSEAGNDMNNTFDEIKFFAKGKQ